MDSTSTFVDKRVFHIRKFISLGIGILLLVGSRAKSRADYTTIVNPGTTWGVWEGWGASLCWWANVFGQRDDMANVLFTLNNTYFPEAGATLPGLGMNIVRYNAGACSWNSISGATMQVSPNIPAFRQME